MKFNEDRPFLCTRMPLISKSSATRSSSAALIRDAGIASTELNEFLNTPIKRSSSSDRSKDFPSGSTPAVDFVKALLNHTDKGVTGIYARWHTFEEKREAVMAIEAAVLPLMPKANALAA